MVQQTDYHGWDLPEVNQDEDKWGDYIRNTFQANDEETVKKDTFANRPSAGSEGRWFLATDRMTLYYDTGSQWNTIVGQEMAGTSVTLEHLTAEHGATLIDDSSGDTSFPVDTSTYDSASYMLAGQHGLAAMLVPQGDATGQDKASVTWRTRQGEKVGGIVAHEEDNEFSVYTRDGTAYDGSEGSTLKALDIRGGAPGQARFVRFQNSARFYWDGKTHGGENRIQYESADGLDTYIQFSEDTNGIGAEIRYQASNGLDFSTGSNNTTALSIDGSQNVDVVNGTLSQGGTAVALTSRFPIPNSDLQNASVTIGGNTVALGNSTAISAHDLSDSGSVGMLDESESVSAKWSFGSGLGLGAELDTNGNHLNLDDGDQWITIHDGHGNYNIKSGVDPSNTIVTTAGGSHIQLSESGGINLIVDDGTATGNAFSTDVRLAVGSGSVNVSQGVLQQGGTDVALTSRFPLPNSDLSNSSVTVAGNSVSLGGSTSVSGKDLSDSGSIAYRNENEGISAWWEFQDDTQLRFGANADYGIEYDSGTDELHVISDPTGSPTTVLNFQSDNDAMFDGDVNTRGDLVVATANNGVLLTPGVSGGTRFGLKYGSANSIGDTDDLMVTNREAGGALHLAANDGTGGQEAIGMTIPSGTTPRPNAPNGLDSGGDPVPKSSTGTEYDIQKNGTDGTGVINFKT